jgi:hypothetical protein
MADIGKLTSDQINALKAKHKDVYVTKSIKDGDTHFTYVKKPDLNIISAAAKYAETDPVKSGLVMLKSTRIGGSDEVLVDDEMKMGVMAYVGTLFKAVEVQGKKL